MNELTGQMIGGRLQMLVLQRHGRRKWRHNRHNLIVEAARMQIKAIEHGREMFNGADAPTTIRSIAAVVLGGNHPQRAQIEQALTYLTAACDEDPNLLEQLVAEDNPSMKTFTFICHSILHTLMLHAHHGGPDPLMAFLEISESTR